MTGTPFVSPEKPPEGLARELLTIALEEAAEVQQRITKILRFGLTEVQPGQPDNNRRRLGLELGDMAEVVHRLKRLHLVDNADITEGAMLKGIKLDIYLQNRE